MATGHPPIVDRDASLQRRSGFRALHAPVTMVGESGPVQALKAQIAQIARSDAKVLITGESGTGKELVARTIHAASARADRVFLAVNCAGLPETLLESELFGHVRGSFTGAYRDKAGKLEAADHGTIFLDEIGEMTLRMQGLLLRFLETGEIQKVGADHLTYQTNVRIIAATNRHLPELIAQRLFREDLYYRLKVIQVEVPPLRRRASDIPLLIAHFLGELTFGANPPRSLSPEAEAALCRYHWPGNVRELENVIERLMVTSTHSVIGVDDLPWEILGQSSEMHRVERRRTVADDLYERLTRDGESFWTVVYPAYMQRDITRANVRDLVRKGLEQSRGSYRILLRLFNMEAGAYKRFLNFLRKHDCQLPFRSFR